MIALFDKFFGKSASGKRGPRDEVRYEREKVIAQGDDLSKRMSLAKSSKTHQEILYYLAEKDPDSKVRAAVAKNKSTPIHASPVLASDVDVDVRMALAGRMVELLPELTHDKHSQLYAYVVQALGTLALDEVLKVRKALASTLKDHAAAPPKVAGQLARDIEREVAEPILRFCAALADEDLLEILKEHPAGWAIEAIALRPQVSAEVSEAVIETDHVPAGALLIKNEGAQITQVLLEHIIDRAREYPEWHEPLAGRKTLPPQMAKILAEFVDESVRKVLLARGDFDELTMQEITAIVRRRIDFETTEVVGKETPTQRARRLKKEGQLTEETISDALAMRDKEFVVSALAVILGTNPKNIEKVFGMKAPKPICAVSWRAGMSMRMALKLQQEVAQVPIKELLYPKDGTDYPLTPEDMKWQLEFLGLEAA